MVRSVACFELGEFADQGQLWTIVDACNQPLVPPKMYEIGEAKAVSLYQGEAEYKYAEVAPYLAHVDRSLLDWILSDLWAKPWGVFAVVKSDLETLRRHFRKFLMVKDPDGGKMYFRYYDPRVLRVFLPTCLDEELEKLFGPVQAYGVGEPDSDVVKLFNWKAGVERIGRH